MLQQRQTAEDGGPLNLGRGLHDIKLARAQAKPKPRPRPISINALNAATDAAYQAMAKVAEDAAKDERIRELEAEIETLRYDLRMARLENERLQDETDARVQEVQREADKRLLAEQRRNVAGRRLDSILSLD